MKQLGDQLSIFDIIIERAEEPAFIPDAIPPKEMPEEKRLGNLCPYPIPTVNDIVKRIEKGAYQIPKSQLISDMPEIVLLLVAT